MSISPPATILIVDDDLALLRLVHKRLRNEQYSIAAVGSGREAIQFVENQKPDLLLLDLKLPDVDGSKLIDLLEEAGHSIPFIIITGQGDERVAVEMMRRGALDYLVKDMQFMEFVPTIVRRGLEQLEKDKQLQEAQQALKESQEEILTISEREQTRFGAELHDGIGQQLTAIEIRCQALLLDIPQERDDLKDQIAEISKYLREAVCQTRSLARDLSPAKLGSGGLPEALSELAARMNQPGRMTCKAELPSTVKVFDSLTAHHLFRIAQEGVNNAVKHAGATEVRIRLSHENGVVQLVISDNGHGLLKNSDSNGGIGLQIMKHRASVIGGHLEIESQPDKGVIVTCTIKSSG